MYVCMLYNSYTAVSKYNNSDADVEELYSHLCLGKVKVLYLNTE